MSLYDAFISYSHAKDKPVASALQAVMQKLGKPWYRRRALRIFRDDTSLAATPELWPTLEKTLDQSRFILLLASPQFARSKWCGMEVAHWLEHKSLETILIAVTEGDLLWDGAAGDFVWHEATPLPPVLKGQFRNEPKWIDLRPFRETPDARDQKFIDAAADLAAAVHGLPKEDLLSQELRQQKRALRLAWSAAASLTLLAGGAAWQWWEAENARRAAQTAERMATEQKGIAEAQRDLAERNLALARKAADDLVFKIAQGLRGVEGMRIESVRQILETAQRVMDQLVRSAPNDLGLKRSRYAMLVEFAVTYQNAGDLTRARTAAEQSLDIARELVAVASGHLGWQRDVVVGMVKVGDIQFAVGDRPRALAAYEQGVAALRKLAAERNDAADAQNDLTITLDKLGRVRRQTGDQAGALAAFEESTAIRRQFVAAEPTNAKWRGELASGLDDIGGIYNDRKDWVRARAAFDESLVIRRKLVEEDPGNLEKLRNISVSLQKVGNLRRQTNDQAGMAAAFEEGLAIMRKLAAADPGNVVWQRTLGVNLYQVGDVRIAAGDRAGGLEKFQEALAIRRKLASADPSNAQWQLDMVTGLFRVATLSRPGEARALLNEALTIAEELARERRVTGVQLSWPKIIRDRLATLPPVEVSAGAEPQAATVPSP